MQTMIRQQNVYHTADSFKIDPLVRKHQLRRHIITHADYIGRCG